MSVWAKGTATPNLALHLALKRTVALKMILAAGAAGAPERARFKAEAQAVARLQHPGIVQIHEVGEHQGRPFCALEFVAGGSLAQKLHQHPLPARDAARLVEALARAMHLAHSHNVVHRDLKPANVLLTPEGTPKITDFGLARQLDADSGQTQAGAVMGTPSYMAPEQAAGRTHEAGPAADVYALGAILYECLTGQPPFRGATVLETLEQVRTQEPVPPRRVQPKVPADLETICLRCLVKEPEQRYASGAELADELGRFLRGEPILARPVGWLERAARWARRKPALAAALAAALVSLVMAIVGASWSAARAAWQTDQANSLADQARKREVDAIVARTAEEEANRKLTRKKADLERAQDNLETTLARTWLAPLTRHAGPLTDPEVAAVEQLAQQRGKRLAQRFVREALTRAEGTAILGGPRAAYLWHAALGLDRGRRAAAERLLLAELQSARPTTVQRQELALSAVALGDLSPETTKTAAIVLIQAMARITDPGTLRTLGQGLLALAPRLEPKEAAATLTEAMNKTTNVVVLCSLLPALSAVAARLKPKEAAAVRAQAVASLTQVATRTNQWSALLAVAGWLDSKEAAKVAAALIQALPARTWNDPRRWSALAEGLTAVSGRLKPKEAAETASLLVQALSERKNWYAFPALGQGLLAVAARLEPKEAAAVCAQAVATLTQAIRKYGAEQHLAQTLSAVAARLDPKDAAAVCAQAVASLTQVTNRKRDYWRFLTSFGNEVKILSAVAARLESQEVARVAATLIQAMNKTNDPIVLMPLAGGLSAVAARLEPKQAAKAALCLTQAINKTKDPRTLWHLTGGLSAVAARLEPQEVAKAALCLTQAINRTKDPDTLRNLTWSLSAVAARLESQEVAKVAATLIQAMDRTTKPAKLQHLAECLSAVAARLGPKEAAKVCARAAAVLTDARSSLSVLSAVLSRRQKPALLKADRKFVRPLPAQFLVDMLKHPLCVGEARRLALVQLTRHYGRPFADQWEFVRFAQEQKLGLDLLRPPRRVSSGKPAGRTGP